MLPMSMVKVYVEMSVRIGENKVESYIFNDVVACQGTYRSIASMPRSSRLGSCVASSHVIYTVELMSQYGRSSPLLWLAPSPMHCRHTELASNPDRPLLRTANLVLVALSQIDEMRQLR